MLFDDITGVLGGAQSWVEQQWTQRIVQISVYAAILFFVLSSFDLINKVDGFIVKSLNVKLGKEGTRALHAVTLGFFMYVGVKFILDPFVHKFAGGVEGGPIDGTQDVPCDHDDECNKGYKCHRDDVNDKMGICSIDDSVDLTDPTNVVDGADHDKSDPTGVGIGDNTGPPAQDPVVEYDPMNPKL